MESTPRQLDGEGVLPPPDLLAEARFAVPRLPAVFVSRPRLLQKLEAARTVPLVLVSAPAGTGKTSLVADWLRGSGDESRTGWVTFEASEEPAWPHLVHCLERLGVESPVRATADSTRELDRRPLSSLAAALAGHPRRLTVVLDGYEFASAEEAQDLDLLLHYSNDNLQAVIVTRADPVLPLYRYRLEDELVEIRAADLAFTDEETLQLLRCSGVPLTETSARALNLRTRGWAAGLRFATRTLIEREAPDRAVASVVAETGEIGEYLMGEVLDVQTVEDRQLLLNTSVPETLFPGLLEELGGRWAGRALGLLTRRNAFVEQVAGHPGCYRYFPFFRDLLRAQLAYEAPEQMVELQRRTARWFAREGQLESAVRHFAAVDAWQEAADEVVSPRAVSQILLEGESGSLARALQPIPSEMKHPAAATVRAALALTVHDVHACDRELAQARATGSAADQTEALVLSQAVLDAMRARYADDPKSASELAEEALRQLRQADHCTSADAHHRLDALVHSCRGIAWLRRGSLADARQAFLAGAEAVTAPGCEPWQAECLGHLGLIHAVTGELANARRAAARSMALGDRALDPSTGHHLAAQVALAWVAWDQYDVPSARQHVSIAMQSDSLASSLVLRSLLEVVKAGLERARGRLTHALGMLQAPISELTASRDHWLADRLRLELARLWLASGEAELALRQLEEIVKRDEPDVVLVSAQAQLAQGHESAVEEALARTRSGTMPVNVQVVGLLLEAAQESRGQSTDRARVVLDRSLRLAAREGMRRPFREAPPMIQRLVLTDPLLSDRNRWLTGTALPFVDGMPLGPAPSSKNGREPQTTQPVETLTAKELEVLVLLAQLLSTEEVADAMFVSVNTVRTHVRNILRKLGVSRRNAAVRRARELGLVAT